MEQGYERARLKHTNFAFEIRNADLNRCCFFIFVIFNYTYFLSFEI